MFTLMYGDHEIECINIKISILKLPSNVNLTKDGLDATSSNSSERAYPSNDVLAIVKR